MAEALFDPAEDEQLVRDNLLHIQRFVLDYVNDVGVALYMATALTRGYSVVNPLQLIEKALDDLTGGDWSDEDVKEEDITCDFDSVVAAAPSLHFLRGLALKIDQPDVLSVSYLPESSVVSAALRLFHRQKAASREMPRDESVDPSETDLRRPGMYH